MLDFDDIFNNYVADNQKVWQHDRNKSLGASSTFACIRQGWFEKFGAERGYEVDHDYDPSWGAMERGNVMGVLDGALQPFVEGYLKWRAGAK